MTLENKWATPPPQTMNYQQTRKFEESLDNREQMRKECLRKKTGSSRSSTLTEENRHRSNTASLIRQLCANQPEGRRGWCQRGWSKGPTTWSGPYPPTPVTLSSGRGRFTARQDLETCSVKQMPQEDWGWALEPGRSRTEGVKTPGSSRWRSRKRRQLSQEEQGRALFPGNPCYFGN